MLAGILIGAPSGVPAVDHHDIDEGRPIRLDDAFAMPAGEFLIKAGSGVALARQGVNRGSFSLEIDYGLTSQLQVGIMTLLATDPRSIDGMPASGDLTLDIFYNLNDEKPWLPAFAIDVELTAPTGVTSRGGAVGVTGIATKSFDALKVHLNAGYQVLTAPRRGERDGVYAVVLGVSHPLGPPASARATLLADVYVQQAFSRGDPSFVGIEIGLRYRLSRNMVWDVAMGREFAGPKDRSDFQFATGFSFGF